MATNHSTTHTERRYTSAADINQLSAELAVMAGKAKNQSAKSNLLLAAALLIIIAFEHPNGLELEVSLKPGRGLTKQ
jgi:hypothetical protein